MPKKRCRLPCPKCHKSRNSGLRRIRVDGDRVWQCSYAGHIWLYYPKKKTKT